MNEKSKEPIDKAKSDKSPSVELRSDVSMDMVDMQKKWSKWFVEHKMLAIIIGVIIVLLVGIGVYAGLGSYSSEDGADGDGIFGELPLKGDRGLFNNSDESGLSGRTCDEPDRRAVGVMLAGDPINRPVSGFAQADLVFELPVLVSDVTRLLAVYQCGQPGEIGSVRSARHDYLFLAEGVDAIVGHWGGSYHALNRIAAGEFDTINALSNPFNAYFRKSNLPAPYNGFTTYEGQWNALQKLGYRTKTEFRGYAFKDDPAPDERGAGGSLSIAWPGQFRVKYEYDPATNTYQRYWAGVRQVDGEDGATPVAPSVVVVMRATNEFAEGEGGYNDVGIEGEGDVTVYQDGGYITGRWSKDELNKNDKLDFVDESGKEIEFTRGQVWITAVEPNIDVSWEPVEASPVASESPAL